ncbi:hypothetical protein H106_01868 [Trichophyton rubrum CBS 735.88]|nr:hypothetical protein H106_01868 [Trichophyton rubrum CBS 735.88]
MTATSVTAALLIAVSVFFAMRRLRGSPKEPEPELVVRSSEAAIQLNKLLASALPEDVVVLPQNAATFRKSMNTYWAQQECEVVPALCCPASEYRPALHSCHYS